MALVQILAQLSCSDLRASVPWFATLFGREPDERPMQGLVEWHHGEAAGLQLFEDAGAAGHGTLTLIVQGIQEERERLAQGKLDPGDVEPATSTSLVQVRDPDGNLVVLAELHPGG